MYCICCGKEIDNDTIYCKYCGENINKSSGLPKVKRIDTIFYIGLNTLTVGFYQFIWLLRRYKALNCLSTSKYHKISWIMIFLCFINSIMTLYNFIACIANYQIPTWVQYISTFSFFGILILTVKIIKIIENYALYKKGKIINHNIVWMLILNLLYANFSIEDFKTRIENGLSIEQVK